MRNSEHIPDIICFGIDFDACLSNPNDSTTAFPPALEKEIINALTLYPHVKVIIIISSYRQSAFVDAYCANKNRNGSCFEAFVACMEHFKHKYPQFQHRIRLDKFLLEDIHQNHKAGVSFSNAMNLTADERTTLALSNPTMDIPWHDLNKKSLMYAHFHYLGNNYPTHRIFYCLIDDILSILNGAHRWYCSNSHLIPRNVSFSTKRFYNSPKAPPTVDPVNTPINGVGMTDKHYLKNSPLLLNTDRVDFAVLRGDVYLFSRLFTNHFQVFLKQIIEKKGFTSAEQWIENASLTVAQKKQSYEYVLSKAVSLQHEETTLLCLKKDIAIPELDNDSALCLLPMIVRQKKLDFAGEWVRQSAKSAKGLPDAFLMQLIQLNPEEVVFYSEEKCIHWMDYYLEKNEELWPYLQAAILCNNKKIAKKIHDSLSHSIKSSDNPYEKLIYMLRQCFSRQYFLVAHYCINQFEHISISTADHLHALLNVLENSLKVSYGNICSFFISLDENTITQPLSLPSDITGIIAKSEVTNFFNYICSVLATEFFENQIEIMHTFIAISQNIDYFFEQKPAAFLAEKVLFTCLLTCTDLKITHNTLREKMQGDDVKKSRSLYQHYLYFQKIMHPDFSEKKIDMRDFKQFAKRRYQQSEALSEAFFTYQLPKITILYQQVASRIHEKLKRQRHSKVILVYKNLLEILAAEKPIDETELRDMIKAWRIKKTVSETQSNDAILIEDDKNKMSICFCGMFAQEYHSKFLGELERGSTVQKDGAESEISGWKEMLFGSA